MRDESVPRNLAWFHIGEGADGDGLRLILEGIESARQEEKRGPIRTSADFMHPAPGATKWTGDPWFADIAALLDERFCRMWEFYLAASECAFRFAGMNNFQIQFARNQHVLPLTRNYMIEEEERLRQRDSRRPRFKSVSAE